MAVAVASAQMAGARGELRWCQEGAVLGKLGAHEVVSCVAQPSGWDRLRRWPSSWHAHRGGDERVASESRAVGLLRG